MNTQLQLDLPKDLAEKIYIMAGGAPIAECVIDILYRAANRDTAAEAVFPPSWNEIDPDEPPLTDDDIAGIEEGRMSLARGEGHSLAEFLALTE